MMNKETIEAMVSELNAKISGIFPESFLRVAYSESLCKSICVRFAIGKDKTEWSSGYIDNDICHTLIFIWIGEDGSLRTEMSLGNVMTKPTEKYMAYGRHKVGFRSVTSTDTKKVVSSLVKYFDKLKTSLVELKDADKLTINIDSKLS